MCVYEREGRERERERERARERGRRHETRRVKRSKEVRDKHMSISALLRVIIRAWVMVEKMEGDQSSWEWQWECYGASALCVDA